jgi:hypothetical protein
MYGFCKKILLVFILISITLIAVSQETIEVQLVSISNIYYERVGDEWSHDVIVNQKALHKNKSLSFNTSETNTLCIKVNCQENDKKYPDCGNNCRLIELSKIDLSQVYLFTIEVTVIENAGQKSQPALSADRQVTGKGNKVKWKYSFKIK